MDRDTFIRAMRVTHAGDPAQYEAVRAHVGALWRQGVAVDEVAAALEPMMGLIVWRSGKSRLTRREAQGLIYYALWGFRLARGGRKLPGAIERFLDLPATDDAASLYVMTWRSLGPNLAHIKYTARGARSEVSVAVQEDEALMARSSAELVQDAQLRQAMLEEACDTLLRSKWLSDRQRRILALLRENRDLNQKDIAQALDVDRTTVGRDIDRICTLALRRQQ